MTPGSATIDDAAEVALPTGGAQLAPAPTWRLGHQPALDGLRGVAIALVVAYHLVPRSLPGGPMGVDLFFVLSGFLITSLLIDEHDSTGGIRLGAFYVRRARRLFPALAVFLVVVGAVMLAAHAWNAFFTLGYVVGYVANYAWNANHLAAPVQHCWSLAIEEQFYLVWPAVLVVFLRVRNRALVAAAVAALVLAVMVHRIAGNSPTQSILTTDLRADGLLVGCLLACLFAWFRAARWTWWPLALAACPLLVGQALQGHDLRGFGYTVIAVLFAFVLAASITCEPLQRVLSIEPLRWLGRISYSLYLWHYPVFTLMRSDGPGGLAHATVANSLPPLVVSFVLAVSSYEFVEKPFMRSRRAISGKESATSRT